MYIAVLLFLPYFNEDLLKRELSEAYNKYLADIHGVCINVKNADTRSSTPYLEYNIRFLDINHIKFEMRKVTNGIHENKSRINIINNEYHFALNSNGNSKYVLVAIDKSNVFSDFDRHGVIERSILSPVLINGVPITSIKFIDQVNSLDDSKILNKNTAREFRISHKRLDNDNNKVSPDFEGTCVINTSTSLLEKANIIINNDGIGTKLDISVKYNENGYPVHSNGMITYSNGRTIVGYDYVITGHTLNRLEKNEFYASHYNLPEPYQDNNVSILSYSSIHILLILTGIVLLIITIIIYRYGSTRNASVNKSIQ